MSKASRPSTYEATVLKAVQSYANGVSFKTAQAKRWPQATLDEMVRKGLLKTQNGTYRVTNGAQVWLNP